MDVVPDWAQSVLGYCTVERRGSGSPWKVRGPGETAVLVVAGGLLAVVAVEGLQEGPESSSPALEGVQQGVEGSCWGACRMLKGDLPNRPGHFFNIQHSSSPQDVLQDWHACWGTCTVCICDADGC